MTALRLDRSLSWPVGVAEAELSALVAPPDPGVEVNVSASVTGRSATLLTGMVRLKEPGPRATRLLVEEPTGALARVKLDRAWKSTTAGQVIRELCGEASVTPGIIEPGATLPAYACRQERSALDQILRLCTASGLLARTDADGKFHAATPLPAPVGLLKAPAAVLDWSVAEAPDLGTDVTVSGDGAMGLKGPGASSWVIKDPSSMTSGNGGVLLHLPELKTVADVAKAQKIAQLRLTEAAKTASITLADVPPGDLGDVIGVAGFGALDGAWRITGIQVRWGVPAGFTCQVQLTGAGVA